jgi:acetyltransferase-like isoleucine patch superfamily enzyme
MPIKLTQELIEKLQSLGVSMLLRPGVTLPDDVVFEPPCSLKWMGVNHSLHLGAFSYAVSGFYFGCRIGRYCSFGEQIQIGRHPHPMHWASTSPFFYWQFKDVLDQPLPDGIDLDVHRDFKRSATPVTAKLTVIGNDVWIGHGAFILPGVQIGDGAVIAAMSVVTKNVPPYAVVAGSPAKIVRYRFPEEQIEALQASKWWEFAPWQLKGARVDVIQDFLEFVAKLSSSGETAYAPEKVKLGDFADKVIKG